MESNCTDHDSAEYDSKVNQDELIMAQERKITEEIKANTDMVGPKVSIMTIKEEYAHDTIYLNKVEKLEGKFSHIRRCRPDGNCFLRGLVFAYLEHCINHRDELLRLKKYLEVSKSELLDLGFPKFTTEDFYDIFMDVVSDLERSGSIERVEETCNDPGTSDYLVVYLRLLISAHLQRNAEFFSSFIEGDKTMEEFVKQEVEPMYRECDHLHIVALTAALGIGVRVTYLDRGEGTAVVAHDFPEDREPIVNLLYRPGHYDVLYVAS